METYTLLALANKFGMKESTLRHHVKRYLQYLPTTGEGNARRYKEESIPIIAFFLDCVERKMPQYEIESLLDQQFPKFIDIEQDDCVSNAMVTQPVKNELQIMLLTQNKLIENQGTRIAELEFRVNEQQIRFSDNMTEMQNTLEDMQDSLIMAQREIEELREKEEKRKVSLWKRLFGG